MSAPRWYAPERPAAQPIEPADDVPYAEDAPEKPALSTQPNNLKAIFWMIGASGACTALVVSVRELSSSLPTAEILFFRSAFSAALLLPWLFRNGVGDLHRFGTHDFSHPVDDHFRRIN